MIGQAVTSGVGHDVIDAMLHRSGGEVLRIGTTTGGELDYVTDGHVTARDMRRLRAAGLVSPIGMHADRLAAQCGHDGDVSSFVEWWCETGLSGLDDRADRRDGDEWCTRQQPVELPTIIAVYLDRLVFADKRTYAEQYAEHVLAGGPAPADPGTEWAVKARAKVDRLARLAGAA